MPKDIRSFFKPLTKTTTQPKNEKVEPPTSTGKTLTDKKEKAIKTDKPSKSSSSSRSKKESPKSKPKNGKETKKIEVVSSDSDCEVVPVKSKRKIEVVSSGSDTDIETPKVKKTTKTKDKDDKHSKKEATKSVNLKKLTSTSKKPEIDSDDDTDFINPTPDRANKKRKLQINSDSDEESKLKHVGKVSKVEVKEKLKPVSIADIFGGKVNQSKVKTAIPPPETTSKKEKKSKKVKTELGVHQDADFEKTLIDLDDDDIFLQNEDILDKTIETALIDSPKKTQDEEKKEQNDKKKKQDDKTKKQEDEKKKQSEEKKTKETTTSTKTESKSRKRLLENEDGETPSKKTKFNHTDSGFDDQERYEKKKYWSMQYQNYLTRGGPKNHGCKEYPKGKPDCLSNLTFMRTGVLDSLEQEEFEELVKKHGGNVISNNVTKKVNYLVVGEEPGPSKLQKAEKYGIPTISEDELLDMILQKSGMPKKYTVMDKVSSFEDAGINDSFVSTLSEETVQPKTSKSEDTDLITSKKTTKEEGDRNKKEKKESNVEKKNETKEKSDSKKSKDNTTEVEKNLEKPKNKESTEETKYKPEEKATEALKQTKDEKKVAKSENKESTIEKEKEAKEKSTVATKQSEEDTGNLSLSEKYKPKDLKQIVGQQSNNSNMNRLIKWLESWDRNEKLRKEKKIAQPKPWDKTNDGAYFKCALLSGPPGVGKTTTATLVAENLGFDIVEFNASDTRSKKLLQQEVATALNSQNIASFTGTNSTLNHKRVILMDEVDGMAGNEDRGGMQELIALIKTSKIPIICMCNDRNHQKMKTLANYCFDLRFEKPKPQQILGFVMSICCKEGIRVNPQIATEIINGTTCDIRQTLNQLSMLSNLDEQITLAQAQKDSVNAKKDTVLGPWQVCKMVFNEPDQRGMSLIDKSRLFFYDYSMGPLFVQENYLKVQPNGDRKLTMKRVAAAAEAISMGATIDRKIRESNNWSLLDLQAIYSSVLPGHYMSGNFTAAIDFPSWLGKNSKRTKIKRMTNELSSHTRLQTSGGLLAMNLDYSKALLSSIATPLKKKGMDGVRDSVEVMKTYQLLREDLDNLVEVCSIPRQKNVMDSVESKVKAAFTRLYNKEVPLFSYSANVGVSKKKASAIYDDNELGDEVDETSETEDTIENDNLIKAKSKAKTQSKKETTKATTSKASTSKGTTSKGGTKAKGKGKK